MLNPEQSDTPSAVFIDLTELSDQATKDGPQLGMQSEDLNLTVLSWSPQGEVKPHINNEVDVVVIAIAGTGDVTVNGQGYQLHSGQALLIHKGTERAIKGVTERFSYLSVHRRRQGLWPAGLDKPQSSKTE